MSKLVGFFAIFFIGAICSVQAQKLADVPLPTQAQLTWQNAELAALVCWDLHAHDGEFYVQSQVRITPVEDYNIFNPQKYDTDQWIKTLKEAGFKMAILTVSHEIGFFFHQSDATPYSKKALKWQDGKGDVLRDFKASCEKYGILPGVYIGTRWNAYYGVYDFKVNGNNQFAENRQQYYNNMIEKIVEEIFSQYGDWAMVWFDGGAHGSEQGGPDVLSVFEKYQPNCLFYHNLQRADMRWGGSESGTVPYPCWGTFLYPSIGLIPEADASRLKEFGKEIEQRFSNPVGSTSGTGKAINLKLTKKQKVNQVVLMEDISKGERVRKFVVEGKTSNGWHPIFEGSCIGHKLIHQFDNMEVSEVRLKILESEGEPQIKNFQVFKMN